MISYAYVLTGVLVMAAVTYVIRALPLAVATCRRPELPHLAGGIRCRRRSVYSKTDPVFLKTLVHFFRSVHRFLRFSLFSGRSSIRSF